MTAAAISTHVPMRRVLACQPWRLAPSPVPFSASPRPWVYRDPVVVLWRLCRQTLGSLFRTFAFAILVYKIQSQRSAAGTAVGATSLRGGCTCFSAVAVVTWLRV